MTSQVDINALPHHARGPPIKQLRVAVVTYTPARDLIPPNPPTTTPGHLAPVRKKPPEKFKNPAHGSLPKYGSHRGERGTHLYTAARLPAAPRWGVRLPSRTARCMAYTRAGLRRKHHARAINTRRSTRTLPKGRASEPSGCYVIGIYQQREARAGD